MADLRLYNAHVLKALAEKGAVGKQELERKLEMVRSSDELTNDEKDKNIDLINFALGGGVHFARKDVIEDMKAGKADTDDIGGH